MSIGVFTILMVSREPILIKFEATELTDKYNPDRDKNVIHEYCVREPQNLVKKIMYDSRMYARPDIGPDIISCMPLQLGNLVTYALGEYCTAIQQTDEEIVNAMDAAGYKQESFRQQQERRGIPFQTFQTFKTFPKKRKRVKRKNRQAKAEAEAAFLNKKDVCQVGPLIINIPGVL
jgi:hypothetical protein